MKEALHLISADERRESSNPEPNIDSNNYRNEYYLFNLSGGRKKVKVLLPDILLVRAIKGSHADKLLYLKEDIVHVIRGHALEELIKITGFLLQCNKQDLVSPDAINYLEDDTIYLNGLIENGKPIFLTLNRTYKKSFLEFFYSPKKR
jgi:hypothetical protein